MHASMSMSGLLELCDSDMNKTPLANFEFSNSLLAAGMHMLFEHFLGILLLDIIVLLLDTCVFLFLFIILIGMLVNPFNT